MRSFTFGLSLKKSCLPSVYFQKVIGLTMIGIAFLANLSKREEYQTKDEQHAGDRDETRLLTVLLLYRKIFGIEQLQLRLANLVSNVPSRARPG